MKKIIFTQYSPTSLRPMYSDDFVMSNSSLYLRYESANMPSASAAAFKFKA